MNKMLGATEFKTHFLRLIKEIERTGEPVTVTHRGEPVVEIRPAAKTSRKPLFGCMKGTITFLDENDDLLSAINPDWEAQWEKKWDDRGFPKP